MSVAATDMLRGTGPLTLIGSVVAVADALESKLDAAIKRLEAREKGPRGAGTQVLQDYADDPYLLVAKLTAESEEQCALTGQLNLLWNPPIDTGREQRALDHQKAIDGMARQEKVVLGSGGTAMRVIGV